MNEMNPVNDVLAWEKLLRNVTGDMDRLDSVNRYNSIPIVFSENNAEHHAWVCIYSLLIHTRIRPYELSLLGPIASHAISHDFGESLTGDVHRLFKYRTKEMKKAVDETEALMIQDLPDEIRNLMNLHIIQLKESGRQEEEAYVKKVVKMGDFLSLWRFMRREMMRGNKQIGRFVDRMIQDLKNMESVFRDNENEKYSYEISNFYLTLADSASKLRNGRQ